MDIVRLDPDSLAPHQITSVCRELSQLLSQYKDKPCAVEEGDMLLVARQHDLIVAREKRFIEPKKGASYMEYAILGVVTLVSYPTLDGETAGLVVGPIVAKEQEAHLLAERLLRALLTQAASIRVTYVKAASQRLQTWQHDVFIKLGFHADERRNFWIELGK